MEGFPKKAQKKKNNSSQPSRVAVCVSAETLPFAYMATFTQNQALQHLLPQGIALVWENTTGRVSLFVPHNAWKQLFQGGRVSPPLTVEPPGSGMLFDNNVTVLNGLNNLTVNQLLWSPCYVIAHWSVMSGCILPSKAWFTTSFTSVQLLACTAAAQTQNELLCFRMLLGVNNPEEI